MALKDLSASVDLHKSTVHRLLSTLLIKGYVTKDDDTGKYRLTMKLFEISGRVVDKLNVLSVARPYLNQLAELTGESVHLAVRDGTMILYIYKEDSSSLSIRMGSYVGLRNPMYCTGLGKAILSCLPIEEVKEIWNSTEIKPFTEKTITNINELEEELSLIRKRGYAIDDEEHEAGLRCIATPIKDFSNNPIAAISVSSTVSRLNNPRIQELSLKLINVANKISFLLGGNV